VFVEPSLRAETDAFAWLSGSRSGSALVCFGAAPLQATAAAKSVNGISVASSGSAISPSAAISIKNSPCDVTSLQGDDGVSNIDRDSVLSRSHQQLDNRRCDTDTY
jgi:hypothetical protein